MKIFEFVKLSKKLFTVKKFIKPTHSQEYYYNKIYQRNKDRRKSFQSNSTQPIFPMEPLNPDPKQSLNFYDEQNEHYIHYFVKSQKELESRLNKHIHYAKGINRIKGKEKPFKNSNLENYVPEDIHIDRETGLMYGLGYDEYISNKKDIDISGIKIDDLVAKLGYLDFRDFVALNKYILDAKNHKDNVIQTKARFLSIAMSRLNEQKKKEVQNSFKKLEQENKNLDDDNRIDVKIEWMFNNLDQSKEIFYKHYYSLKEKNQREELTTINQFEKYDKMMMALNNPKIPKIDKDSYYFKPALTNHKEFSYDLNDKMEQIIKTYRDQRTIEIKADTDAMVKKMQEIVRKLEDKTKNKTIMNEFIMKMSKYHTFLGKYKRSYVPTNIETERLMNKYLREKRLKEFTKEKMMEEEDPYYSPLTDDEDLVNRKNIFDENSKQRMIERHNIKNKYFDAKYQYRLKLIAENVDKEIADQLGIIITNNTTQERINEIEAYDQITEYSEVQSATKFIDKFVDDHYKSFKLNYMYNYMDYFSNKYKARKRIAEELKRKVSIKEINFILSSIVSETQGKKDLINRNGYNVSNYVKNEFGEVIPSFVQEMTKDTSDTLLKKDVTNSAISLINDGKNKPVELNSEEQFELEIYKGIKNDPYFKHYLYTNFAKFSETMSDTLAGMPYMIRGYKPADYLRYEGLKDLNDLLVKKEQTPKRSKKGEISLDSKSQLLESIQSLVQSDVKTQVNDPTKPQRYFGFGKRKKCKAYAEITPGKGIIKVNGRELYHYFNFSPTRGKILYPLALTGTECLYDIKLRLQGGGVTGQADAAIPAISKALIQINPEWKTVLAKNLCLKHDPRNVEPKKPGRIKARKGYVYNRR